VSEEQQSIPTQTQLSTVETKKFVLLALQKAFPTLPKRHFSLTTDHYDRLSVQWQDGPTEQQVSELCEPYIRPYSFVSSQPNGNKTFAGPDGAIYISGIRQTSCTRRFTVATLRRFAVIVCRKHGQKLPDIYLGYGGATVSTKNDVWIETEDETGNLSRLIRDLAEATDVADLPTLEAKAQQYGPLPDYSEEELREREAKAQENRLRTGREFDMRRREYLFMSEVYQALSLTDALAKVTKELDHLATLMARIYPTLKEPVICSYCGKGEEGEIARKLGRFYVCVGCIAEEAVSLSEEDFATDGAGEVPADLISVDDNAPTPSPESLALMLPDRPAQESVFKPLQTWDGVYIGKNGDPLPILTRDLLHDIRFGNWWLGFAYKPTEAIREALRKAGWRWGWGKREWYHPNKFGIIPALVIEEYGAYIDGGFCHYRETRGERLRDHADRVEAKADTRQEMSNDLVMQYMKTGTIIVGPRRTRALQKKQMRAQRYAEEARNLDAYAQELRQRANQSERHQARVTTTPMLLSVIKRLQSEARKLDNDFIKHVERMARHSLDQASANYCTVEDLVAEYEEVDRQKEVISEEIEWLEAVIGERRKNAEYKRVAFEVQPVPNLPQRDFAIEKVTTVNVGSENRLDLYPTPPDLSDRLLNDEELYPIPPSARYVIECHGGTAALLRRIQVYLSQHNIRAELHTCELNYELNEQLQRAGYMVKAYDFLQHFPQNFLYDCVVMNPPFSAWLAHVLHGLEILAEGGTFLAILPLSFFSDNPKIEAFRDQVESDGAWVKAGGGFFKESGTDIEVVLVSLQK
jgi:hypothetical protein